MRADTRTYTEKHTRVYASPAQTFLCPDTEIKLSSSFAEQALDPSTFQDNLGHRDSLTRGNGYNIKVLTSQ